MKKLIAIIFLILVCFAFSRPAPAADSDSFVPWNFTGTTDGKSAAQSESSSGRLMAGVMGFYSKYVSAVDGDRCSMYPSCSRYSAQAFRKHGIVMGALMTADRLIHEADESGLAPKVNIDGHVLNYDPVSNNDFWWHKAGPEFDKP